MKIKAFGREWDTTMNGRVFHSEHPNHHYDDSCVSYDEKSNCVLLTADWDPKIIEHKGQKYDSYYKTGLIRSTESFGFGMFKADIVLPKGLYLWPAFWLTPDGQWPPEIDVMEAYSGHDKVGYKRNILTYDVGSQVHYGDCQWNHHAMRRHHMLRCFPDPQEEMIEYSLLWTQDEVRICYNGFTVLNCTGSKALKYLNRVKMHVVFDLFVQDGCGGAMRIETPMVIKDFAYDPLIF